MVVNTEDGETVEVSEFRRVVSAIRKAIGADETKEPGTSGIIDGHRRFALFHCMLGKHEFQITVTPIDMPPLSKE